MKNREQRIARAGLRGALRRVALVLLVLALGAGAAQAQINAYVTNPSDNQLTVIDTATQTVTATVPLGASPRGLAIDPVRSLAYVLTTSPSTLTVVDLQTNAVATVVPVAGDLVSIALSANGDFAYLALLSGHAILVIDTATNAVAASLPLLNAAVVVLAPDGSIWASDTDGLTLVIDTTTQTVTSTFATGRQWGDAAFTPNGALAYLSGIVDTLLVDVATKAVLAFIPSGFFQGGIVITPDGASVYQAAIFSPDLFVIDTATNAVATTIPLAQTTDVAITPDGAFVYVTLPGTDVQVVATATNTVVATVPVGLPNFRIEIADLTPAPPANQVVTSLADDVTAGDGACTLREAIANATTASDTTAGDCAAGSGANTITFDPALVAGGDATISLTLFDTGQDAGEAGPTAFVIPSPRQITISGPTGDHGITVERDSGAADFRLFHVRPGAGLTLENLTLQNGVARGGHGAGASGTVQNGGGGGAAGLGGGIYNEGTLALSASTLVGNRAQGGNGGNGGTSVGLTTVGGGGGGLSGDAGGQTGGTGGGGNGASPNQSGFAGGFGSGGGGGDFNTSGTFIRTGTNGGAGGFGGGGGGAGGSGVFFVPGAAGVGGLGAGNGGSGTSTSPPKGAGGGGGLGGGGAIFNNNPGAATLTNCTLSGNTAQGGNGGTAVPSGQPGRAGSGWGGAVLNRDGTVTINSSTLADNSVATGSGTAATAAGGAVYNLSAAATLTLDNTILADTQGGASDAANRSGTVNGGASNIVETNDATNPLPGAVVVAGNGDPLLDVLADNGGPTFTQALQVGSPAVDAGDNATCQATDQRGVTRPQGAGCDIGAYELVEAVNTAPALASDQASVTVNEGQAAANTGTVSDADNDTVTLTASVGTVVDNGDGTWSWSFLTSDGPAQSQTVTITGDDGQGGVSDTTFALVVDNVAPTITSVSNNGPINTGGSATITVTATDPAGANDPLGYSFDCDNNGSFESGPQAGNSAACTFATAGSKTVNVRVTDGDGGTATGSTVVTVLNQAPVLASDQASVTVNEGQSAANTGTVSDADNDTVTLTASVGTVVNNGNGTWSWSFLTSDGPVQSQAVTITGNDGQGGVSATSFGLVVNNVAPTIASVSNNGPINAGGSATITVSATDPAGANDPLSYSFDCDNNGVFEIGPQAGNSAACTFATAGSKTVNVRVTDGDGGVATGSTVVSVLTPQGQVQALIAQINALVTGGVLAPNKANPLINKLENVLDKLDKGNTNAACGQLGAFINQVNAYIGNGTLTAAQGQALIAAANAIRTSIGC